MNALPPAPNRTACPNQIEKMEPIVRWAGSKRQLLPKLSAFWPKSAKRYVEPFCGSACLFFHLEPDSALLGDLNPELIMAYRVLRTNPELVCECLRRFESGPDAYYRIRAIKVHTLCEAEIAARFIYLNRYCFNGIYRTNKSGDFNVPYGAPKSDTGIDFDRILAGAALLRRTELINGDFEATLDQVQKDDFVYLDPPYAVEDRRIFAEYHESTFKLLDLDRLNSRLQELDKMGALFVISYADSKEARKLLAPWRTQRVRARRHIAGFSNKRRFAFELMATNIEETQYAN
jgi:DNA adenine methylase